MVRVHKPMIWASESGQIRRAVEPFLNKRMNDRKDYVRLEWLPTIADKPTMCRSFQARTEQRKVFLPKGKAWAEDLVRQLMRFPKGKVDDKVDVCGLFGRIVDKMHSAVVPEAPTLRLVSDSYRFHEEAEESWKTA
jgi:predicted phage terminase large subunit-like protein